MNASVEVSTVTRVPVAHPIAGSPTFGLRSNIIDAWRAVACLSVVWFHAAQTPPQGGPVHPIVAALATLGGQGYLRVDVFFVISGYCLAQSVERHVARGLNPIGFWRDRLLRIYPTYWCAFVVACLFAAVATPFNGLRLATAFPNTAFAWVSDLALINIWSGVHPHMIVSWSLDYEIGFYVLIGFALVFGHRSVATRLGFYGGTTALALLPEAADAAPILRLWPQFACGIAVCFALRPSLPTALRVGAMTALLIFGATQLLSGSWAAAFAPLTAIALAVSLHWETRLPPAPRVLTTIGAASFSIYLLHVPVMSPVLNLVHRLMPRAGLDYTAAWFAHLALGVFAGLLFHRWVEQPLEQVRLRAKARLHTNAARESIGPSRS